MLHQKIEIAEINSADLELISGGELSGGEIASWGAAAFRVGLSLSPATGPLGAGIMALGATAILVGAVAYSVETARD